MAAADGRRTVRRRRAAGAQSAPAGGHPRSAAVHRDHGRPAGAQERRGHDAAVVRVAEADSDGELEQLPKANGQSPNGQTVWNAGSAVGRLGAGRLTVGLQNLAFGNWELAV